MTTKSGKNQKILVTGLNGFVGRHLLRELKSAGHLVYGVSREPSSSEDIQASLEAYWQVDLTDLQQLAQIDWSSIDSVIHLAGLAAVGPSFDNPQLYHDVNVGIIENLFKSAEASGAKPRIISVSTGAVYGRVEGPVTEDSAINPGNPYGESKVAAEKVVLDYREKGFADSINVRPFNHAGPGQALGFLIPDLGSQLVAGDDPIQAGNLTSSRDYTDVRDVVRAYRMLAEKPSLEFEVYNLCSGKAVRGETIFDILKSATQREQATLSIDGSKLRSTDEDIIVGSNQRISDEIGWQPEIPLSKTIQDYVDFEKAKR